jgi:rod shape-determining protein MreD
MIKVISSLSILFLAIMGIVSWGFTPTEMSVAFLFIVTAVIFFWNNLVPEHVSPLVIFLTGLVIDALSNGPLGYWAAIYLLTIPFSAVAAYLLPGNGFTVMYIRYCLCVAGLAATGWAMASLYAVQYTTVPQFVVGAVVPMIMFPMIYILLWSLDVGKLVRAD